MPNFERLRRTAEILYHRGQLTAEELAIRFSGLPHHPSWPHHVILIAGLPKSGTNWMMQLLARVPGYKLRTAYDPDGCLNNYDVCEDVFKYLPPSGYYVLKFHTRYTPENKAVLDRLDLRTVVMYRDLRDQAVSRYFHALYDPEHRHYSYYNSTSKPEAMMHNIRVVLEAYIPWIRNWRKVLAEEPERFFEVRYEDLNQNTVDVLENVLDFYGIQLPYLDMENIVRSVASQTKFDLKENLRKHSGTARKGIVGDWRNHFEPQHITVFKEQGGQFLMDLGYEQDLNW